MPKIILFMFTIIVIANCKIIENRLKVRLISDIHLEINPKIQLNFKQKADIVILAGDIGNPYHCSYDKFLMMMSLTHSKVFVVSGNHEYYNNDIKQTDNQIRKICNEYDNVHFLQKDTYIYKGVKFIGTTLWSNPMNSTLCKHLNDFSKIKMNNRPFTNEKYKNKHLNHKSWLENELIDSDNKNINFVITHHLPLVELIGENKQSHMKSFYASNINTTGAHYWCYGHTHHPSYKNIGNVEYHCNPKGYNGQNLKYNFDYIFQIPLLQ
jgi:predicted phosphodiesterase